MKIGNLGKAIACASLWFYAAYITNGVEHFWQGAVIAVGTFAMSAFVIFYFDREPDTK